MSLRDKSGVPRLREQLGQVVRNSASAFGRAVDRVDVWLSNQHLVGLIQLILAFALIARPSPSLRAFLQLYNAQGFAFVIVMLCIFFSGALLFSRLGRWTVRMLALPLLAFGLILMWYSLVTPDSALTGFVLGIGIYALVFRNT